MNKVFVIAEAGVNHNGSINIAKRMIDVAVESRVDAVKFQTFKAERLACKNAEKAEYQKETTDKAESQFEMLQKLELSEQMHIELIEYCQKKNIQFLSTPFDIQSIYLLSKWDIPIIKIPSGEITNLPYLREVAKTKKDVILSTGMSCMEEIKNAVRILHENGAENIIALHCNTQYPTPMEDVNLKAMLTIKEELNIPVGYSDHTEGIEIPMAAVAMGATVIEKHFTLDRNMPGPDQRASIEPLELEKMVRGIRNIEKALGSSEKKMTESESKNKSIARKSIVAAKTIHKGEMFTENNLTTKRPGTGISPMEWDKIIGRIANKEYKEDDLIKI